MENEILELFPDETIPVRQYRSFVNQPERIQVSSQQDLQDYDPNKLTTYYNFRVRLPRAALDVKSIQLARASIPNCVASFPDTESTFWYYALPPVAPGTIYYDNPADPGTPGDVAFTFDKDGIIYLLGVPFPDSQVYFSKGIVKIGGLNLSYDAEEAYDNGNGEQFTPVFDGNDLDYFIKYDNTIEVAERKLEYLRYIRLLPSFVQPDLMLGAFNGENFGYNKVFEDYDSLVAELQKAKSDDPLNNTPFNNILNSFQFVPNDVSFRLDSRFNRIVFTGEFEDFLTYLPAAADDELWNIAAILLGERDKANDAVGNFVEGAIAIVQPWIEYRNLNLRLGFNYATYPSGVNYFNMLRPHPEYAPLTPLSQTWFDPMDHLAPGYVDLVNTSCCHIYCDFTGGSTVDSIANKALLASIPMNTTSLGIGFHSLPLNNPLTKIANQIDEVYIELRTDAGQPFYIGNNAIVSLELILTY